MALPGAGQLRALEQEAKDTADLLGRSSPISMSGCLQHLSTLHASLHALVRHPPRDVLMLEGAERGGSAAATAAQVERAAAAAQPQVGADRAVPEMMEEEEEGRLMEECEACERK